MIIRRWFSTPSLYVEKMKLLEYWKVQDDILRKEFLHSKLLLMVDKSPLVVKDNNGRFQMATLGYSELKHRLNDFGVHFDVSNSCLLDCLYDNGLWKPLFGTSIITTTPPADAPVDKKEVLKMLANTLKGSFVDLRTSMFLLNSEEDQILLSRFHSLSKWAHNFCHCPRCGGKLIAKVSKSLALCGSCNRTYYPQIFPAIITLIKNRENTHLLLVRQKHYSPGTYTLIAGFANGGESLNETVRREVAEEVGIYLDTDDVKSYNYSQPWPLPDCSLMIPHVSIGDINQTIDKCPAELEAAHWFSREEVQRAYDRTCKDPMFKNSPRKDDYDNRQKLLYVPPKGAVAFRLIGEWLTGKL